MTQAPDRSSTKAPTSADVARLAGVSRSTVSFVLNNAPQPIPEQTRQNVLRAAKLLNYRPNLAAKSLAEGSSRVVLIVLPAGPSGPLHLGVLAETTATLLEHGLVPAVHLSTPTRNSVVPTALQLRPRAVVVGRPLEPADQDLLEAAGIGVLVLGPTALLDVEARAAELRLNHLRDRGHAQIAVVDRQEPGPEEGVAARRAALVKAAESLGLPELQFGRVGPGAEGAAYARVLVSQGVTAVCAYNDDAALTMLRAIADAGLRCPADLAVIGNDDTFAGSVAFPRLSTVAADSARLGPIIARSVEAALGLIEPPAAEDVSDVVALVVREST